jgi:hypothetical protein
MQDLTCTNKLSKRANWSECEIRERPPTAKQSAAPRPIEGASIMPVTLVAPPTVPESSAASPVSVRDLSNGERAVALYASDLPDTYSYRPGDDAQLESWILQGAFRMGLEVLYRTAALTSGYQRSWLSKQLTAEQKRAQAERFPNPDRLIRAEQVAAMVTFRLGVSNEAKARGSRYMLDGSCPECGGTEKLFGLWAVDADADWYEEGYRSCWRCQGGAAA